MAQTATRRIARALQSDDSSGERTADEYATVASREDLEAAVKEGVVEGLDEYWLAEDGRPDDSSESSSHPVLRFLGGMIVLAVLAYAGRKWMSAPDAGGSDGPRDVPIESSSASGPTTGGDSSGTEID